MRNSNRGGSKTSVASIGVREMQCDAMGSEVTQPKSRALATFSFSPRTKQKNRKRKSQKNQKPKTHKSRKKKPPKEPIPKGSPIDP